MDSPTGHVRSSYSLPDGSLLSDSLYPVWKSSSIPEIQGISGKCRVESLSCSAQHFFGRINEPYSKLYDRYRSLRE